LERIKIAAEKVDRRNPVGFHRGAVTRIVADREQAAVHFWVQRLDPAVHHLGKAGELRDVAHRKAGVGERLAGAAGRDELDLSGRERAGEIDEPRLVGDREQGAGERTRALRHGNSKARMPGRAVARIAGASNRRRTAAYCWSMIFSENRYPLFGIML